MQIRFLDRPSVNPDDQLNIVVGCFEGKNLTQDAKNIDLISSNIIARSLENNKFKGKIGQTYHISSIVDGKLKRIIVIGFGKAEELTTSSLADIGGVIYKALATQEIQDLVVYCNDLTVKDMPSIKAAPYIAQGIKLRAWRCDEFKTKDKEDHKDVLQQVSIITEEAQKASESFAYHDKVADGVLFSRYLGTLPPNILYPETMADLLKDRLEPLGVKIDILDLAELTRLKMGALLGVAQGSTHEARVVVMQWQGSDSSTPPLAFLGKGVTFDSGGISLKPALAMEDMKYDMCGAAAVSGLMHVLAASKAKVNVVGVVGLVENMPSSTAQRPSDIVTSLSGQTIEVLNTDAEGRLVLTDVLWYTQQRFKPKFMVNLATLTGAICIALGKHYAGLFSNNDELSQHLTQAGEQTGEKLWRLPMAQVYDKELDSDIADIKNITGSREAGSVVAAQFLQRFVNGVAWAHLDIAGVAYGNADIATCEGKGANGFGVRLLANFIKNHYQER